MLWHQRLGHTSRDIMTRLVKDEVLPHLDFSDFEKCVECIKGKMTKGNKKGVTRSTRLLELIHTDICRPFPLGIGGHKSFITFIDDYSRYMYLYLINEKSESLEMIKTFKAEVETKLDRTIKVVRSDMGGEYYGRHKERLRRSQRNRKPANFDDYYTYLNEANFDLGKCNDLESFEDAITCDQSAHWREAMEDELNSMSKNNV
ncbi:putative RNA-directed DNA polymerase [Tanacetum coccineum]